MHFATDFAIAAHGLLLVAVEFVGVVGEAVASDDVVDFAVEGIANVADVASEVGGKLGEATATNVVWHVAACDLFDFCDEGFTFLFDRVDGADVAGEARFLRRGDGNGGAVVAEQVTGIARQEAGGGEGGDRESLQEAGREV